MAKIMVPIIKLEYKGEDTFTNELHEVFEEAGVWNGNEDFTFTGRVSISEDAEGRAEKIESLKKRITDVLIEREGEKDGREAAARLIALLEANAWDVSFYVDCW